MPVIGIKRLFLQPEKQQFGVQGQDREVKVQRKVQRAKSKQWAKHGKGSLLMCKKYPKVVGRDEITNMSLVSNAVMSSLPESPKSN